MAVYVDDMFRSKMGEFRGMKMSHMMADTHEELMAMAHKIGLRPEWLQNEGEWLEHFDVAMSKREQAVQHGAVEISMRKLVRRFGPKR